MSLRRTGVLLACLLPLTACVRIAYTARWQRQPLDTAVLIGLRAGTDNLETCLAALGAPVFVWEYRGSGVAIGYVHSDTGDWSVQGSYSFGSFRSVSLGYGAESIDLPGVVLWFDESLRLIEYREGNLRDLTTGLRRPAPTQLIDDQDS